MIGEILNVRVNYKYFDQDGIGEGIDELSSGLGRVTSSAQGEGETPSEGRIERMRIRILKSQHCFLSEVGGKAVGFGLYDLIPNKEGKLILYEDGKMVSRGFQGQGIGAEITRLAVKRLRPDYFVMRTQNPAEVISVRKVFPGLKPYRQEEHENVLRRVAGHCAEVPETDFTRGVFRPKERRGKIGDYKVDRTDPRVRAIEELFSQSGLGRDYGERLYFIAVSERQEGIEN